MSLTFSENAIQMSIAYMSDIPFTIHSIAWMVIRHSKMEFHFNDSLVVVFKCVVFFTKHIEYIYIYIHFI